MAMGNGEYICWGEDREDLTAKVSAAKENYDPHVRVLMRSGGGRKRLWRVKVTCSQNHVNIFEGED